MKLRNLITCLGKKFPKSLAEFYDHVGYMTGVKDLNKDIKKIFLCLDFTEACLDEVRKFKPDLILTHHPFFFGKRKQILENDNLKIELENEIYKLGCPLYSYHTNFDKADFGMNDTLLSFLSFKREKVSNDGCMRIFSLENKKTTKEVCDFLCEKFSYNFLMYIDNNKMNKRVAFLAGGGGNSFMDAIKENVDLYISGDISHHARLDIKRYSLNYIELPHECEEIGFILGMKEALNSISNFEIKEYRYESYFSLFSK